MVNRVLAGGPFGGITAAVNYSVGLQVKRDTGHDLRHRGHSYRFVIILALLGVLLLFVRCMIHCKHLH